MAGLSPLPRMIFWDANGDPLSDGAQLYTYDAGTTTPRPTYTDQGGLTPNPNPLDLDGAQGTDIWFNGAYKIDVKDQNGVSLPGYPVDNVVVYNQIDWSGLTATIAELNACDTSTLTKTTVYTVGLTDRGKTILCDATSAGFTVNLPSAASATNGFEITFKKIDVSTNLITLDGYNAETIEGRTTFILYDQNDTVTLLCDGNNWRLKSGIIRGNTQVQSAAFSVTIADIGKTFICSATTAYAVTLLSAVTAGDGFRLTFKKTSDPNPITITPAGMETIDGIASLTLSDDYQGATIISDGSNWYILSGNNLATGITGDIKYTIDGTTPSGWIPLNDGTIGSATSGATTRANADTQSLFVKLWNNVIDAYCPVSGGRGATGLEDFNANKTIRLPFMMGRVLGVAGSGVASSTFTANTGTDLLTMPNTNTFMGTGTAFTVSSTGTLPAPLAPATTYYAIVAGSNVVYVATSRANAVAGSFVDITTTGTGVHTIAVTLQPYVAGEFVGEETHTLVVNEIPAHTHNIGSDLIAQGGGCQWDTSGFTR